MPNLDNGDHISGRSRMMGHCEAPITTDETNDSSDYDEEISDIPEDAQSFAGNAMASAI
jgi:hypothetical protein